MTYRYAFIAYSDALSFHLDDMVKGFGGIVAGKMHITPMAAPSRLSVISKICAEVFGVVEYLDQRREYFLSQRAR